MGGGRDSSFTTKHRNLKRSQLEEYTMSQNLKENWFKRKLHAYKQPELKKLCCRKIRNDLTRGGNWGFPFHLCKNENKTLKGDI